MSGLNEEDEEQDGHGGDQQNLLLTQHRPTQLYKGPQVRSLTLNYIIICWPGVSKSVFSTITLSRFTSAVFDSVPVAYDLLA